MWIVDFKERKAEIGNYEFENQFAMNKLLYRSQSNQLYSFGGYNSAGMNFKLKMEEGAEWEELERSHMALVSSSQGNQS